ncbi:hypothetical protein D9M73_45030 [compost metagenome]
MDLLRIAAGRRRLNGFGGFQHHAVKLAQCCCGFFALGGLALEGIINRLAESVPELLLLLALDRHALRFMLPALLQRLDGINAQLRLGAQHLGLFNHGLAACQAFAARGGQRCIGDLHRGFPLRLDFCKGLFAQVTGFAPFLNKTIEAADVLLPVGIALVGFTPGQHFINQHLALGLGGFGLFLDGFQPGFDNLVRFVAGVVKTFPQGMVGRAALVAGFPLLAHVAQGVLLLAPAHGFGHQCFGLDDQLFADLVGTPALPAFEFAGSRQRCMSCGFELAVDVAYVFLQCLTQVSGDFGRGLAVAFGHFMFEFLDGFLHDGGGLFAQVLEHRRVNPGLGWACALPGRRRSSGQATCHAQLVGPHGHSRQRRSCIVGGLDGRCNRALEGVPHRQQLAARGVQQRRELGIDAGPVGVLRDLVGLALPVRHVGAQGFQRSFCVAPGLDREHFDALGDQHGGFALHLGAVLQVFNRLDALGQLHLEAGQRFFGKRRAGFGGITLPGQGIGQVEFGRSQQCLRFFGPFGSHGFLALAALDLVELFLQRLGSALVAVGQVLVDIGHLLGARLRGQPGADARGAFARGRSRKRATREAVQRMGVMRFGGAGFCNGRCSGVGFG